MLKTAGETLKQERYKKSLSFEQIEKITHIRAKNLKAIEESKWEMFPSQTYIQGIITTYGKHLDLDIPTLLAYFRREYEEHEMQKFKTRATKEQFTPQTKKVIRYVMILIFVLFASYFGYQLTLLFRPPEIIIFQPTKTAFKKEKKILLKGQTNKETIILINDDRVYLKEDNTFETEIPLTKEENVVTIKATGANGRSKTIQKTYTRTFDEQ
jgi:cytoskeletal protein RodZ